MSTTEATPVAMAGADLIVAGSPLLGFTLPTESMLKNIAANAAKDPCRLILRTPPCVPA